MNPAFTRLIRQATRATRDGDPADALRRIRAAIDAFPASVPAGGAMRRMPATAFDWSSLPGAPVARPTSGADPALHHGRFENHAGGRAYRLYVPPGSASRPMPLVVMLHGCTQTPEDIAAGTRLTEAAAARRFCVLYPEQATDANPRRCWNWFEHAHQRSDRGEPAILAGMTRAIVDAHRIDPARVFVAGMSSGGAMAALLASTHPTLYEAIGVHSGLAAGSAADLQTALHAMRGHPRATVPTSHGARQPRMIVFHGAKDAIVDPANAGRLVEGWLAARRADVDATALDRSTARLTAQAGGRACERTVWRDAGADAEAPPLLEQWIVHGAGHAWSGGSAGGSYTDPRGPDATREMLRFFLADPEAAYDPPPAAMRDECR
ncbi:MAG: PHB depolymerase family esterase [Lautropia sp.]